MPKDGIELDYFDCLLRKSDLELLSETCWINDNLIAFAFEYFEREQFQSLTSDVAFIGPHVVQCIKFMSEEEARAMLEPLNMHSKRLVLIPVNDNSCADSIGGSHWSLIVYSKIDQTCRHYDSMNQGNFLPAQKVWNTLKLYFKEQTNLTQADTPQQINSCDCGVYVICIAESLCHELHSQMNPVNNGATACTKIVDYATSAIEPSVCSTVDTGAVGQVEERSVVPVKSITPVYVKKKRTDLQHLIRSLRELQSRQ